MNRKTLTQMNIKYIEKRKKLLQETKELIYQRTELNKRIRSTKTDMEAWDRALLQEEIK